jgi:sirohydrochlorin cobaltochelatase
MLAIILFAHGSRDPLWRQPIEAVAARVAAQAPGTPVSCAYLELCTPDLPAATHQLIAQGATTVRVVPLFLGTGKHAREDLPLLMDQLQSAHPDVAFTLQTAVGEDTRLLNLMAQIALDGPRP